MIFSKLDIKSRIVLASISVLFFAVIAIGAISYWHTAQITEKSLDSRILIEAGIISQNMATPILFDDATTALEILESFRSDPAILEAVVTNRFNEEFIAFREPNNTSPQNILIYSKNITFNNENIGRLELKITKSEVFEKNTEIILFLIGIVCIVITVALGFMLPIVNKVLRPLIKLHATSEEIAKTRNYGLRAPVESKDEIGRLALMFNAMLEQIEHRDDMLEEQVSHRTDELEKLVAEFRFRAFHDTLTGLPNRALLNERFEKSVQQAKKQDSKFACLLLDLDNFKTINDTKGHEFGDTLLVEVALRLKNIVRERDLVCRLGGDEFVIILNDLKYAVDVIPIANKILNQFKKAFEINGEMINTAPSIGGAIYPDHGEDGSIIKRLADVAMYRAKDAGKNRFCLFSPGMQEDVKFRLLVQTDLKNAIKEKHLEVYLQPKVDAQQNILMGCEALIRWHHPTEGFLPPDKFIPFAEELGLIDEIDYFVIRESCEKILEWETHFDEPLNISVNLSGRHFHDFKIVDQLKHAIKNYHVEPWQLEVEITEAVLINDPTMAKSIFEAIKALGVRISLDDFGTGYSSLNYLRTLPIDTVKLDQSFVANIETNPLDRLLVGGIISLAHDLGLTMVAEGIEKEGQLKILIELNCPIMQGYYFLKPTKFIEFMHWYSSYFNVISHKTIKPVPDNP